MFTKIFLDLTRPPMPVPAGDDRNAAAFEWSPPAPAWSGACSPALPPAHTQQDKLELMQWIAFACMVIDHLGFFGPAIWGSEPSVMRFIGRLAYPLFVLVFAWRLAHITWRNPKHDFVGQFFKLMLCAGISQIAWGLTGAEVPINVVMGFGAALVIIVLSQEDRNGYIQNIPLGVRFCFSIVIAHWVHQHVDFGFTGLAMTLAAYSSIRFADEMAKGIGCFCLFLLTLSFPVHGAFVALPVAWLIINGNVGIKKRIPNLFYWLYPLHIVVLAFLVNTRTGA